MRSLSQITSALRSGEPVEVEELRAAVVAYDVLLSQLDLPSDARRLGYYFQAAECDPEIYAGETNALSSEAAQAWYKAMLSVGTVPADVHQWDEDGEQCVKCLQGADTLDEVCHSRHGAQVP